MDTCAKHPKGTTKAPPVPVVPVLAFSWVLAIACLKWKGGAALRWRPERDKSLGARLVNRATSPLGSHSARAAGNPSLPASLCAGLACPLLAAMKREHPALGGALTKAWSLMKETQYLKRCCLTASHPSSCTYYLCKNIWHLPWIYSPLFLVILFGFFRKHTKKHESKSHI